MKPIRTIDEVIAALDHIIEESKQNESPLGYFAALYRSVTKKVKDGIAEDFFEDGPRMEQLDVIFAKRYIDAYHAFQSGQVVTKSWLRTFDLSEKFWPIVLQHLLIGMNAHINLDLGIAAAEVMKGKNILDLKVDFNRINQILSSLVMNVQQDLSEIWPTLTKILKWTGEFDDLIVDFSMEVARNGAWEFAVELSNTPESQQPTLIISRDERIAEIGDLVTNPGFLPSLIFKIIRLGERGSVVEKIERMEK
jgi:hypothetical protein